MNEDVIKDYIIRWNYRFPFDRIWRKKYNVAFNSFDHRESSFLDQFIDIKEDELFEDLKNKQEYIPNIGDFLKIKNPELSFKSEIEEFNKEFGVDGQEDKV